MVKKFILVFKTHFDIGFTDLAENVIRGYGDAMLKEVSKPVMRLLTWENFDMSGQCRRGLYGISQKNVIRF